MDYDHYPNLQSSFWIHNNNNNIIIIICNAFYLYPTIEKLDLSNIWL
jgi:hypothetical protein